MALAQAADEVVVLHDRQGPVSAHAFEGGSRDEDRLVAIYGAGQTQPDIVEGPHQRPPVVVAEAERTTVDGAHGVPDGPARAGRKRRVGMEEDQHVAGREACADVHGVGARSRSYHSRRAGGASGIGGAVGAPGVDHDHLDRVEGRSGRCDRPPDRRRLGEGRHDDRDPHAAPRR